KERDGCGCSSARPLLGTPAEKPPLDGAEGLVEVSRRYMPHGAAARCADRFSGGVVGLAPSRRVDAVAEPHQWVGLASGCHLVEVDLDDVKELPCEGAVVPLTLGPHLVQLRQVLVRVEPVAIQERVVRTVMRSLS